jgi:hypothetical protein
MDDIKSVIIRESKYRDPAFFNVELIRNLEIQDQSEYNQAMNKLFVFPCFMKPGKQIYVVAYPDEHGVPSFFVHKIIVRPREESVPHFIKDTKTSIHGLAFDRNKTIWREWKVDTPDSV